MQAQSSVLNMVTHLTFIGASWRRFCYESHSTDEKCMVMGTERFGSLPAMATVSGKAGTETQQTGSRVCVLHHYSLLLLWKFIGVIFRRKGTLNSVEKSFHVTVSGSRPGLVCVSEFLSGAVG